MRFIGNKELIVPSIKQLLDDHKLLDRGLTLFDGFCGTGAVADALKGSFAITINDLLEWCVLYSRGRIVAPRCTFATLGFDPFDRLGRASDAEQGFFYRNYSPGGSRRMYFSAANAGRIDHISAAIRQWRADRRISGDEYAFLYASLIESLSAVSNTAGVYGAFLKHWDVRATRPIDFRPVAFNDAPVGRIESMNGRLEDVVGQVECDVLYLDPPYTQNQYGTQYHLLETLVKADDPPLSDITGSRPTGPMRSDWSKDVRKHILFDRVIATTRARHIVFSYSSDGLMSQKYLEAVLKRHAKGGVVTCRPVSYRNYTNTKSRRNAAHQEYLYHIEKERPARIFYSSPVNYIGGKSRMMPFLKDNFPGRVETFVDAFGGAFNVGINSDAASIIYNDYNHLVSELVRSFRDVDTYDLVKYVRRIIKKFGLERENADAYARARAYYNALPMEKRDPRLLYAVILYGFNQQVRFNADMDFNNPVGQRWFNENILEKVVSFSRVAKSKNIVFRDVDFEELLPDIDADTFVYMDPPYRLTTGVYNDGKRGFKGWDRDTEQRLFAFADRLNQRSARFMLSYVGAHKGTVNDAFAHWLAERDYRLVEHDTVQGIGRNEVIVCNYG